MNNNLDTLFKKALRNRSCEPPPRVWENIENRLFPRRRQILGWWMRGAAAAALFAATVWLLQLRNEAEKEPSQWVKVEPPTLDWEEPRGFSLADKEENIQYATTVSVSPSTTFVSGVAKNAPLFEKELMAKMIDEYQVESKLVSSPPDVNIKTQGVRREIIPLTNRQAFENNREYQAILNGESKLEKEKKNNEFKIALSGHVAPVYTSGSYHSSVTNTRGYSYSKSQMSGMMNVSGGLKLSVATGKRLSVQAGLFYSRMGQHTDERNPRSQVAAFGGSIPANNYIVTPLGNIKSHARAVSYRSEEAIILSSTNKSRVEGFEQVFNTLEIPLSVRYRIYENKISLSVAGGLSGNLIVDNKVYTISGDKKEYIGSAEDIRHFNVSTDLGLGIAYPITRKIKIMLEPGFKYYMQSLSRNEQIDFKPYMFSLSTGIGIEF